MPPPLIEPMDLVTWRIRSEDLATLRAMYPQRVNEVIREVIRAYCARVRGSQR